MRVTCQLGGHLIPPPTVREPIMFYGHIDATAPCQRTPMAFGQARREARRDRVLGQTRKKTRPGDGRAGVVGAARQPRKRNVKDIARTVWKNASRIAREDRS